MDDGCQVRPDRKSERRRRGSLQEVERRAAPGDAAETSHRALPTEGAHGDQDSAGVQPCGRQRRIEAAGIDGHCADVTRGVEGEPREVQSWLHVDGSGNVQGHGRAIRSLTSQLANALGRPVRDATELTGVYDITLHYRPDEGAVSDDRNAD